MFSCNTSYPCS